MPITTMSARFVHFPHAVMTELTTKRPFGQSLMSPLHCGAGWVMVKPYTGHSLVKAHLEPPSSSPALCPLLSSPLSRLHSFLFCLLFLSWPIYSSLSLVLPNSPSPLSLHPPPPIFNILCTPYWVSLQYF